MVSARRSARAIRILLGALPLLLAASHVHAEPFSALYIGFASTSDSSYTVDGQPVPPSVTCISSCSSAKSAVGGIRIGYWFERFPWLGVGGDFSAFVANWGIESTAEVLAYPITPLLAVRGRLIKQEGFPNGRVQPYVALGPSLYISTATVAEGWAILGTSSKASATSADIGLDARFGVEILTANWFGVMLEYRYTLSKPSWKIEGEEYETELSTSHFILGIMAHY